MNITEKNKNDLNKIIQNKQIKTVFQPIVSLQTGEILAFEALSRITLISTHMNIEDLFDLANQTNQAWKLDSLCRKQALKSSQILPVQYPLFINVDANILLDQDFVRGFTKNYLQKYHLDSHRIVFELSEKTAILNKDLFKQAVNHYRKQGFKIAIDDAGSGYSNLNRISHVQPEYIKIDRELIQDIHLNKDKSSMVKAMVNYCQDMHYKSIAEGIETQEELVCLIQLGVNYGQGYYFQKPLAYYHEIEENKKRIVRELYDHTSNSTIESICKKGITLKISDPLIKVYDYFNQEHISRIYILDHHYHFIGVLRKEHLINEFGYIYPCMGHIEDLLEKDCLTVLSYLSINDVACMALHRPLQQIHDDIVVLNHQQFLGIVSIHDLLQYYVK